MRREFLSMGQTDYDVLIIGGGITGSCIARDAAMRGLSVALVDKGDFSHATSAASSKLVHGGLRYLKNFELGLVRESLRERRIWQRIAPHMVYPLPFMIPQPADGKGSLTLRIGLTLYDWLSFDRTWLDDADQRLPGHRGVKGDELAARGARIANYAQATALARGNDGAVTGARVKCAMTGDETVISARVTINAAGPWADSILAMAQGGRPSHRLVRAKGIHLITRSLTTGGALAMFVGAGHFFVLPWRGHSIIGTTDDVFEGSPDEVYPTEADIQKMLDAVNAGLPSAKLNRGDVIHAYAGVRPLIDEAPDDAAGASYKRSRKAEVIDHAGHGEPGLISAMGGKWTTSRHVAAEAVDMIVRKLGRSVKRADTGRVPLGGASTGNFKAFTAALVARHDRLEPEVVANLARNYGVAADAVIEMADGVGDMLQRLSPALPDCGAEVLYAMRHEMALTLEDVVFRRTGIGTLGDPGEAAIARVASIMAGELGWSPNETSRQIDTIAVWFGRVGRAAA